MYPEMDRSIYEAAASGIAWLKKQRPVTVKDISRSVQALHLWNESASDLIDVLLSHERKGAWETDTPLTDTARACSALAFCGKMQPGSIRWIEEQQVNDNWNNSEIDTSYALIALADSGVDNKSGCDWLVRNYGGKWEYTGTTALLVTALIKQDRTKYRDFIRNRIAWLLSRRQSGGWAHIATSNLVIEALILVGENQIKADILQSIDWLLKRQENDHWGNITSTALSLISLGMHIASYHEKDIAV